MSDVKITKLPPGKALGADDLRRWAHQRLRGRSGVPMTKREKKLAGKHDEPKDAAARWLAEAERRITRGEDDEN